MSKANRLALASVVVGIAMLVTAGCGTLDKAYNKEVTWTNAPVVKVVTNTVLVTNIVEQIVERTNVVLVTNLTTGAISGYATREPVATNYLTLVQTNQVPVFFTNLVQVPVTNLVGKIEAEAGINAAGSILNMFLPGIGSIVALALGGIYHGYRQVRNRKVNEALIQGVETARAVLETTPQGQEADAQLVKWLKDHQKASGVFETVSALVQSLVDNPAAKMTAQEILDRVQRAQRPATTPCTGPGCTVTVP